MNNDTLQAAVTDEIEELHVFFVDWFSGAVDRDDAVFRKRFLDRLDGDFILIPPSGRHLALDELAEGLRAGHGSNPDFRIAIRNVHVRRASGELVLATYEEWQRNARASTPPDNGRISSVVFRRDNGTLRWLHLHETWLPESVMAAGSYDF